MDDPDVAVFVWVGAEVILVVVAIDAPVLGDGFELVGAAITIGVGELGDLGTLGEVEGAVFVKHAEGLMKAAGEEGPFDFGEVFFVSAFADPDVTASRGDSDLFTGHDGNATELEDFTFGSGDFFAKVVFGLLWVGERGGNEGGGEKEVFHGLKMYGEIAGLFPSV